MKEKEKRVNIYMKTACRGKEIFLTLADTLWWGSGRRGHDSMKE
jgi:hypothetical protein